MEKIMNRIKLFFIHLIDGPHTLRAFKFFCLKIDKTPKEEWDEYEKQIMGDEVLRNFFKIKVDGSSKSNLGI
jgi:hypothetical protein